MGFVAVILFAEIWAVAILVGFHAYVISQRQALVLESKVKIFDKKYSRKAVSNPLALSSVLFKA
jgi:hypothetical protein